MSRKKKPQSHANQKLAAGLAMIAFGGGWGTHKDRRTKRNRSRQEQDKNAIRDYE